MYRNHEGYRDPTAGAAFAAIRREENEKRRKEMLKAAEMILYRKTLPQIAAALGETLGYTHLLLMELRDKINRAKEIL